MSEIISQDIRLTFYANLGVHRRNSGQNVLNVWTLCFQSMNRNLFFIKLKTFSIHGVLKRNRELTARFMMNFGVENETYTMPLPHLSQSGIFCVLPAPHGTFVTGALTLRVPAGRSSEKQSVSIYSKGAAGNSLYFASILRCAL